VIKDDMPVNFCAGCTALTSTSTNQTGLYVAIGVLGAATVFALIAAATFYNFMKKNKIEAANNKPQA
jgi:hypothetical protein